METEAERVANKRADAKAKQSQKTESMKKQPWILHVKLKHQTQSCPHPPLVGFLSSAV